MQQSRHDSSPLSFCWSFYSLLFLISPISQICFSLKFMCFSPAIYIYILLSVYKRTRNASKEQSSGSQRHSRQKNLVRTT